MNVRNLRQLRPRDIGTLITSLGTAVPTVLELARNKPHMRSTMRRADKIDAAYDDYVKGLNPKANLDYTVSENVPKKDSLLGRMQEVIDNNDLYGSSSLPSDPERVVAINPMADRALYAHELGHQASQQTKLGSIVANLRENPKLNTALNAAVYTVPGIAAALESGDDDMDSSLALAALTAAPTLIDEGLATTHGLGILNKAGLRADLGQRGRLAGGLLSYLAPAIIAGTAGNLTGNLFD